MYQSKHIKSIVTCGLLTTITVFLQTAPIYLPGLGMLLSLFSTLPVAIAAIISISFGINVYIASTLLLLMINLEEAIIFTLTTGIIGLLIGIFIFRFNLVLSIIISSVSLTIGMVILTYIIAIPGFKLLFENTKLYIVIIIYILFSLIYNSIWNIFISKYRKQIEFLL